MDKALNTLGVVTQIGMMGVFLLFFYLFLSLLEWNFHPMSWGTFAQTVFGVIILINIFIVVYIIKKTITYLRS